VAVAEDPGLPDARGAVGFGPVIARSGDYFGPLVNLVSRSVKAAAAGQVVVTGPVREALAASPSWRLTDTGSHQLRGIDEAVRLFVLDEAGPKGGVSR
jgi:class 3 adenylate cyclase